MARSSIEKMVDDATGYDGNADAMIEQLVPEHVLLRLADAAEAWWLHKRPIGWTESKHLEMPRVGCESVTECTLARAVATWVRINSDHATDTTSDPDHG